MKYAAIVLYKEHEEIKSGWFNIIDMRIQKSLKYATVLKFGPKQNYSKLLFELATKEYNEGAKRSNGFVPEILDIEVCKIPFYFQFLIKVQKIALKISRRIDSYLKAAGAKYLTWKEY